MTEEIEVRRQPKAHEDKDGNTIMEIGKQLKRLEEYIKELTMVEMMK